MDQPAINRANGADPFIIAQLERIRRDVHWRPAFKRGRMFYDFHAGKVRIEQPATARAC